MRRSTVINHSNNENSKRKRSLEETNSTTKSKKRRHLSPNHMNSSIRKRKSKTRSSSNNSSKQKKKKNRTSSRYVYSIEHLNEITLPNWECISPNIDQILSNKHTQSGVYAHEVHLVQQELEALLSMSILRENILNDLLHPTIISNNQENIRSKILQHKEAENVYTSKKKLPIKPLPPLINHQQQQQQQQYRANGPHLLLDRQVSMTPIIGARIDKIWSDINLYYRRISSNDILSIENLIQFNQQLENKLQQYKNNHLTQTNIIEKLNEENFHELLNITQINSLTTHYIDRTTIGRFQTKLYEHIPQTSPVYKTPISSPFYRKSLGNYLDKTPLLRSSPRLNRLNHFSLSNLKSIADPEQSSSIKSQTKTKGSSLDPSINLQERIQSVRDYLTDQHPLINEQQTFQDIKSTKRRKTSLTTTTTINHCTDIFQSKLLTLITLLHECSTISLCALKRARLQSNNEQIWQKLNTIEHDLELLIEKLDMFDSNENNNNNINMEKLFQTLENLLNDWNKYENDFNNQLEQFDSLCQQ